MAATQTATTETEVFPSPFPASTKTSFSEILSIPTTATRVLFSDKIVLTISQLGRLNHWIHVPLSTANPTESSTMNAFSSYDDDGEERQDNTLLPYSHLTATTVLGGTKPEFEVLGQTLAVTVASSLLAKRPDEQKMLVLGLGLERADGGREGFDGLVGLCLDVL